MALSDDLAASAWLSSACSLGGAPAPPIILFSPRLALDRLGCELSPPGFKRSGSSAAATAPTGHETKTKANWWRKEPPSLDYIGMRQRSDATVASAGQGEREGNRWINSGSRIDLEGMTTKPIRQLAGALGVVPDLEKTDGCAAHF